MRRLCGAKTRSGETCKRPGTGAGGRCSNHGGLSPSGIASPHTIHGRYSRDLPTRLMGRYQEAQADPELTSLRSELALVDARLSDVLSRVDTKEAGVHWALAAKAVQEYRANAHDPVKRDAAFEVIAGATGEGLNDWAAWSEVLALVEKRRRLCETESKRLAAMGQILTVERAMLLLSAVAASIKQHVKDPVALQAISQDMAKLVRLPGE